MEQKLFCQFGGLLRIGGSIIGLLPAGACLSRVE